PQVLDSMIAQRALVVQAHKLGLQVTDQEVLKAAQSIPSLYPNGKFVGEQQFQLMTGVTVKQFMAEEREGLLVQKMRSLVTDGLRVSPEEVHAEFVQTNTKVKIDYVVFDPSQFVKTVNVTPAALEDFYKKGPDRYRVPEQRRVRYALITPDRLRAEAAVSDQDLRQYYSQHLSDYRVPDRVHLERILFKTSGKSPDETAALTRKAQDVLAQIKSGKSFEDLAKKESEDPNAPKGGDAGWIQRGQMEQQLEAVAFSLPPGQVSDAVKTDYGIEIIKALDKQTAHLQSFDEVKDQIQAVLGKQKLADVQQSFAENLDQKLKADPQHFTDIAKAAGLEVQETQPFGYRQVLPDFGNSQSFSDLAFQLRPGEVGQPFSVPKGTVIIQLVDITPSRVPPLDQVRGMVEEDYRASQAKVLAAQKAAEFAAKSASGDFKAVAKSMGLTDKESKDFGQQESVEGLGPATDLSAAFKLDTGKTSGVVTVGTNNVVFRVISRTPANEADFSAQKDQIAQQLLDQKQELAFELYSKDLKAKLIKSGDLKMNDAAMKQFLASYQREGTS
ncbi:MAG TPA: peptidyl-prolyl cis-trans isomerase, partial [Terriglobia bacterium]|nr:peptidyl-prolyl cis-trans isomerase [Terriglobia bacterium]